MASGGAFCALLILKFVELGKLWTVFLLLGMMTPFIAILSGNVKRFFLLLLTFVLPLNIDIRIDNLIGNYLQRYLQDLPLSLSTLIIILLFFLWLIELSLDKNQKVHFFPKTTIPAIAFIGISTISIIINMPDYFTTFSEIIIMFFEFLIYFYLANNVKTEKDVTYIVWVLLFGALLQCGVAILEIWSGLEFTRDVSQSVDTIWKQEVGATKYSRISGTMGHANILGVYLSSIIILLISLIFIEECRTWKIIYWLGIGVGFYAVVNTFSRSAWFVFLIFTPLIFCIYLWKSKAIRKTVFPILVFLFIIAIGGISLSTKIIDRSVMDDSVVSRVPMMKVAVNVIKDNPFWGIGQSNYFTKLGAGNVHNIYLFIAAETGLIGLIIFLWFNFSIFLEGLYFLKSEIGFMTNVGLSLMCLIFMFLMYGMVNPFPSRIEYTFIYFALGVIVAIKKVVNERVTILSRYSL
jgi:O-antigen ligase